MNEDFQNYTGFLRPISHFYPPLLMDLEIQTCLDSLLSSADIVAIRLQLV